MFHFLSICYSTQIHQLLQELGIASLLYENSRA